MSLFFGAGTDRPIRLATDVIGYLPLDKKHQYQDGYSMAEAAKSWVRAAGCLPGTIAEIVGSDEMHAAHFEYPTRVWGQGMAMTDVMAFVPNGVIAVEAKVNERLDDVVSVWLDRNATRNPRSPPHRQEVVKRYAKAFGVTADSLMSIRYQLLQRTLCAALTAKSRGLSRSWMIVQSFALGAGSDCENLTDFKRFVTLVGKEPVVEGVRVELAWAADKPLG